MSLRELGAVASKLGIGGYGRMKKQELYDAIMLRKQNSPSEFRRVLRGGADENPQQPIPIPAPNPNANADSFHQWLDDKARDEGVYDGEDDEDFDFNHALSVWANGIWNDLVQEYQQENSTEKTSTEKSFTDIDFDDI
jgi:hypothetical protein